MEDQTTEEQTTQSVGDSLREIAAWFDEHPEVQSQPRVSVSLKSCNDDDLRRELAVAAKALAPCSKSFSEYSIYLSRSFGAVDLTVSANRDSVCKKIVRWECPKSLIESLGRDTVEKLEGSEYAF